MSKLFVFVLLFAPIPSYAAPDYDKLTANVRATLEKFIEADTTNPPGNESRVVEIARARLDSAGIPYEITEFLPGRTNLVARLKGTGPEKPILMISHTDVVDTTDQPWTVEPHKLTEKDGYLYGRGIYDDLGAGAVNLELLIYLKESNTPLRRDIILALTGDEETGGLGVPALLEKHRSSIDAAFAINEGGGIRLDANGKPRFNELQVAEKIYEDYEITASGDAGHSSVPVKNNAIVRLAKALARLGSYQRPARLMPATRAYYAALSKIEKNPRRAQAMRALVASRGDLPKQAVAVLEEDPQDSAMLRTTCAITKVNGGSGANSLPAEAKATMNCRMLPDEELAILKADLVRVVNDPKVQIKAIYNYSKAPASPYPSEASRALDRVTQQVFPGVASVPTMSNFSSDSFWLRAAGIPSYGFCPFPLKDEDALRAHGPDERISVEGLKFGVRYTHLLLLNLAGGK